MKAYVTAGKAEQIPSPHNLTWSKVPIGSPTVGHQWTDVMMSPAAFDRLRTDVAAMAWWEQVQCRIRR